MTLYNIWHLPAHHGCEQAGEQWVISS